MKSNTESVDLISCLLSPSVWWEFDSSSQSVSQGSVKQIITCFLVKEMLTEVISAMFCINDEVYNKRFSAICNLCVQDEAAVCRTNPVVNTVIIHLASDLTSNPRQASIKDGNKSNFLIRIALLKSLRCALCALYLSQPRRPCEMKDNDRARWSWESREREREEIETSPSLHLSP